MKEDLVKIEIKKLNYLIIEASTELLAFSIFKGRLEEKEILVSQYVNIQELIDKHNSIPENIVKEFLISTTYNKDSIVWGGLYSAKKDNTLIKKFKLNNVLQNGTKKWETRYVLIGKVSGKRFDITNITKGKAVEAAKEKVLTAKEDISIQVEKVLVSHDPTISEVNYIKDNSEHDNIYMFMCNSITFDEEEFDTVYEENVEVDKVTNQQKIKVETLFEYDRRVKL